MALTSDICDYDPQWPTAFEEEKTLLNEMVIAITHAILGDEVTNTACPGSERQNVHGDGGQLWPGLDAAHPPFGLAVNIPLVDVDENKGATRLWPGTCSIAKPAAAARCAPVPL